MRDLSEHPVLYVFADGIAARLQAGQPREAVLAAWAICADGRKVLLDLASGTKEDTESCRSSSRSFGGVISAIRSWWSPTGRPA